MLSSYVPRFSQLKTPFYFYDLELLRRTLSALVQANTQKYHVHYAMKANSNDRILGEIKTFGLGVDCVSGNEVKIALKNGFGPEHIVLAGVGKTDEEIELAIGSNIFSINVESIQELTVVNEIANRLNKIANVSLRINPAIEAGTHQYITTGSRENKFGIGAEEVLEKLDFIRNLQNLSLVGIHYHIGSQITDKERFGNLCTKVNELQAALKEREIILPHLNVGGGLGINYQSPDHEPIPDFAGHFDLFSDYLHLLPGQKLHFELGRSIIGQCGSLISKVLYVKENDHINFVILDAGMTELMRPALYQAYHHIENLTSVKSVKRYDVVGPICETSDTFQRNFELPETSRGDLVAIRSVGAYGESMKNNYNARDYAPAIYSEDLL